MGKKKIWWILIVLWCLFIFLQSNKPAMESQLESGLIVNNLNHILSVIIGLNKQVISENFIRKTAHFIEYFILGCLIYNGICKRKRLIKLFLFSWALGTIYAISDEIHQYFIPGRAMRFFDVCIDSAGVLSGLMVLTLIAMKSGKGALDT